MKKVVWAESAAFEGIFVSKSYNDFDYNGIDNRDETSFLLLGLPQIEHYSEQIVYPCIQEDGICLDFHYKDKEFDTKKL